MTTQMVEYARAALARGWYVFPIKPHTKIPATRNGFKDSNNQLHTIEYWWKSGNPHFNIGIATDPSNLVVVDFDKFKTKEEVVAFVRKHGFPPTYSVQTGHRPEFHAHLYYRGLLNSGFYELGGHTLEIKSIASCITAAGSVHESGAQYTILDERPIADLPDILKTLKRKQLNARMPEAQKVIEGNRDNWLISQAGRLVNVGLKKTLLVALSEINSTQCIPSKSDEDVRRIAKSAYRNFMRRHEVVAKETEKNGTE
jgi:Bifunctional DNA primase/polymerase, N-terminal/Primase C terminal 1 (PriCT-1)